MDVTFPLPDGFFQPLKCSRDELADWKRLVVSLVERTLKDEQLVFASEYAHVDLQQWKQIKTKDQMRVYQPRNGSSEAAASKSPCVLAVGTIEGTLEDVIFGIHNTTTRDIRVTRAFLNDKSLDSAVLHVFENGISEDPYRSLALKWRAVETPAGNLVKNRDGCVLEYVGISHDKNGSRYAFQVSENVDHPICPPFSAQGMIRADVHIRAIYRELDAGRVGVYFYAGYDMSGQIPKFLANWTAASVAFSVAKSVECAEAKKLTALALTDLNVTLRQKARRMSRPRSSIPTCSICCLPPSYLSSLASRSALSECQICTAVMCNKCSSHKYVLSETSKLRVSCCVQCIIAAKCFDVDPRVPLRLVSLPAWVSRGELTEDRAMSTYEDFATITGQSKMIDSPVKPRCRLTPLHDDIPVLGGDRLSHVAEPLTVSPLVRRTRRAQSQAESQSELWLRMVQLQTAAERTHRITKEVNKLLLPNGKQRVSTM